MQRWLPGEYGPLETPGFISYQLYTSAYSCVVTRLELVDGLYLANGRNTQWPEYTIRNCLCKTSLLFLLPLLSGKKGAELRDKPKPKSKAKKKKPGASSGTGSGGASPCPSVNGDITGGNNAARLHIILDVLVSETFEKH